ncbi:hypothetical protein SLS56_000645 [Neofusicoccum ribis]|uniref:HET domain protein n=1 Tax=Neofusicoccum ribis TaxID=45134 RepID=A0ABR3TDM7_9PEZI
MAEYIQQGPFTYTPGHVRKILEENLCVDRPAGAPGFPVVFNPLSTIFFFDDEGVSHSYDERSRNSHVQKWRHEYLAQLDGSEGHLERLDSAFSGLLRCNFRVPENELEEVIPKACALLSRLPAVPQQPGLEMDLTALDADLFLPGLPRTWENLRVVRFVDNNTIRLALNIVIDKGLSWYGPRTVELLDTIGEILQIGLQPYYGDDSIRQTLLTAFLWTSLQRLIMLHFSYILGLHLTGGYNFSLNEGVALLGKDLLQRVHRAGAGLPELNKAMCRCAFELLRSDRASVALDFRDFARRYDEALGGLPARCIVPERPAWPISCQWRSHQPKPCGGDNPHKCMRFKGAKIQDQSAHTASCTGDCPKLYWSEDSYRNGSGARAVSLQGTTNDKLVYCRSSERTMAISHDHQLRDEAIQNINSVFRDSRLTLVCDRDVQLIDASQPSLAVHERILAVLLVCDWNARAWTLLEAMRGRHDVWLLCRHDVPVSFRAALDDVHRRGSVALATLFLTAQHLLPSFRPVKAAQREGMRAMVRGLVSVEEAAMLLSHRHATRPGDEIVIWSLLVGETVPKDALDFWRRSLIVRTGFLVSSVPRLDKLGWSWAPVRPDMPEEGYRKGRDKLVFHQDGVKTEFADVVDDGLDAPWFVGEFPGRRGMPLRSNLANFVDSIVSPRQRLLRDISGRYLKNDRFGALLMPSSEGEGATPIAVRGDAGQLLFAVVGMNDETRQRWKWKGVVEVNDKEFSSLPSFKRRRIILC